MRTGNLQSMQHSTQSRNKKSLIRRNTLPDDGETDLLTFHYGSVDSSLLPRCRRWTRSNKTELKWTGRSSPSNFGVPWPNDSSKRVRYNSYHIIYRCRSKGFAGCGDAKRAAACHVVGMVWFRRQLVVLLDTGGASES